MRSKRWVSLTLALVLALSLLLAACTKAPSPTPAPKPAPAPAPAPAPKPTAAPAPKPSAAPAPKPAPAQESVADFFAKNRVTLIVPYGAGGSSDYAGRLYASFWTEVTGGSMIVKNVPGGGSVVGLEQIYSAKPDGLTLGHAHAGGVLTFTLFGDPPPKFDAQKYNWLGHMSQEATFLIVSGKKPYETLADLQKAKNLKAPALGPSDRFTILLGVASELLGLDARIVPGFDSGTEMTLALARGEVDFMISNASYLGTILKKGDYKEPFLIFDRERSPSRRNVPALTELVKLTPQQDKYLQLAEAMFTGRAPLAPPGMEKAKLDFLRAKTKEIFANKAYVQQAKLQWPDWEQPWDGVRMQQAVEKATSINRAEAQAIVDKIVKPRLVSK